VATPLLYCARRATFYRQNRLQALRLKAFAITEPDHLLQNNQDEAESVADGFEEFVDAEGCDWASALGVLPTATIEEVKQAYKALVKRSHPDLVHDMTPAFVTLADAEMKRLNAAYEEALLHFRYKP
jgi:DnaJ-domain-containing protein 1